MRCRIAARKIERLPDSVMGVAHRYTRNVPRVARRVGLERGSAIRAAGERRRRLGDIEFTA